MIYGNKIATLIFCVGYVTEKISLCSANLYTNASCDISGTCYDGFDITMTADQIDGTENFSFLCYVI